MPAELADLPRPEIETGPPEALVPAARLLAWGEGPRVAALRARWRVEVPPDPGAALAAPLHEAVWHLPVPSPEAAARVADRGFGLEVAREHGWALPGARRVKDVGEVERHLAAGGAAAGAGRWVLKAPYAAAGRERCLGTGRGALGEPRVRRRVEGLLARHGSLLFEPWVARTDDFGAAGLLAGSGVRLASVHRQRLDPRGGFLGIAPADPGLAPAERSLLEQTFAAAAEALAAAGYVGPFGIDAFRWRRPGGGEAFHPLCEINPRLTFGLVARAIAERTGAGLRRAGAGLRMHPGGAR